MTDRLLDSVNGDVPWYRMPAVPMLFWWVGVIGSFGLGVIVGLAR